MDKASLIVQTQRLISANRNAPADRLIRAIFKNAENVFDQEENEKIRTVEEALELWYDLDNLVLSFDITVPMSMRLSSDPPKSRMFVHLIHQESMDKPSIDDIANFTDRLRHIGPIGTLLRELFPEE